MCGTVLYGAFVEQAAIAGEIGHFSPLTRYKTEPTQGEHLAGICSVVICGARSRNMRNRAFLTLLLSAKQGQRRESISHVYTE